MRTRVPAILVLLLLTPPVVAWEDSDVAVRQWSTLSDACEAA